MDPSEVHVASTEIVGDDLTIGVRQGVHDILSEHDRPVGDHSGLGESEHRFGHARDDRQVRDRRGRGPGDLAVHPIELEGPQVVRRRQVRRQMPAFEPAIDQWPPGSHPSQPGGVLQGPTDLGRRWRRGPQQVEVIPDQDPLDAGPSQGVGQALRLSPLLEERLDPIHETGDL